MRYHCIHIQTDFAEEWQKDVFDQQIGELGVDTIDTQDYYIPSKLWEVRGNDIKTLCNATKGAKMLGIDACPDENWNATWESEHPLQELPLGIKIVPHCAFGAGHHETTSMMIDYLLKTDIQGKTVLDHGTGTGVLAIFAKRLGATQVVAIDIDENSVKNAKENARLNGETIDVRLGSTPSDGFYDLILANIHRNILLANMEAYAKALQPEGKLWLSGFYKEDCPILQEAAEKEGLQLIDIHANGEWQLMRCRKAER